MRGALSLAVAVAAFLLAGSGSAAGASAPKTLDLIGKGLDRAVAADQLDPSVASGYEAIAKEAVNELARIPRLRSETLRGTLADVAAQWRRYTTPRALTLFSGLEVNERELADRRLPASGTDVYGDDGVLYRFVTGHGYVFHPLGNFARLNTLILGGSDEAAHELATALVERAVPAGRGVAWEYLFPYGPGSPPWTSGMAQAVAAQALARVGDSLGDQALIDAAGQAYASIPARLDFSLPQGPWIRLYSFSKSAVLNAQLQSAISIRDYAQISGDESAAGLAAQLQATARALMPKFDTGYWSLYSLQGSESTLSYHDYVVSLLKKLAGRTGDSTWRDFADRFEGYESEPPALKPAQASLPDLENPIVIYPDPQDGYLDEAVFRFWLSKQSTVTLHAGGRTETTLLAHGSRTLVWSPGLRAPGTYFPYLTAVDAAGNSTRITLRQVVLRAVAPPTIDARIAGLRTLVWTAEDEGTPWLHLVVRLVNGSVRRYRDLGGQALSGRLVLPVPPGRWQATLVAANSAGKRTVTDLGTVTGPET
jgi:D-glucuronyl C5-epimerase C-terminus